MTATKHVYAARQRHPLPRVDSTRKGTNHSWPLAALILGLPLWWVLGTVQLAFFVFAIPMLTHLLQLRHVQVPRGFGIWLLFLAWVLGGIWVLQMDAPGAVPGDSVTRYGTFFYRLGWYSIGTVAMLYVVNTRKTLTTARIADLLAWFYVALVGGGLLGVYASEFSAPSAMEMILPASIAENGFVSDLISMQTAQLHDFLGYVEPRPSAPFVFTNDWGLCIAMTMPFFILSWWRKRKSWRFAMLAILLISAIPIISSLNRGLWASIIAMALFAAVRAGLAGHYKLLVSLVCAGLLTAALIATSSLGTLITERMNNPHSNEGRGNLSALTIRSALEGSPFIGFGTTRNVAGNFTSIAGGATAECPQCSPPPLGTQGQLWLLIFATGVVGLALYLVFFTNRFLQHLRDVSPYSAAALCSLLVSFLTLPVYDALGVGVYVALLAVGILTRESRTQPTTMWNDLALPVKRMLPLVLVCALIGLALGGLAHMRWSSPVHARLSVLVPAGDLVGLADARPLSLDSEALLVESDLVLQPVAEALGEKDLDGVRKQLKLSAEPNTRVLVFHYTDTDAERAETAVATAAGAYLDLRTSLLRDARQGLADRLASQQRGLDLAYLSVRGFANQLAHRGPLLASTLGALRHQSELLLTEQVATLDNQSAGHPVTEVRLSRTDDLLQMRLGTGSTIGMALGLLMAFPIDRRGPRLRWRGQRLDLPIPIVGTVGPDGFDTAGEDTAWEATRIARTYLPLCGVFADRNSPRSVHLARQIDQALVEISDYTGRRLLLLVSNRSRSGEVRALYASCVTMGFEPVGMVVVHEERHGKGRHSEA